MSYLKVSNFTKKINKNVIIEDVSFSLEKGEVLVILGKSGAGKTTLLRNINFLDFPDTGTLELDGEMLYNYVDKKISSKELQNKHKLIGFVFQNFNLFPNYSVIENVTLAVKLENKEKLKLFKKNYPYKNIKRQAIKEYKQKLIEETNNKALEILKELGLSEKINNYPFQLSGGEQQRVAISRALILSPKVLCFDEPTSALDPGLTNEVIKEINKLKEQKQTMLIITHELDFANKVADKIIVMEDGKIIEERENIK